MSISPIYKCPSCGENSFVVNARLPGSYLIGVCLHCDKTGTLPESAEQAVAADPLPGADDDQNSGNAGG